MNTLLRVLPDTLVRTAALLAGTWAFTLLSEAATPGPVGADIGEGLLTFALLVMVAAGWAAWDAAQRGLPPVVVTWVATGLLTSVGLAALAISSASSWREVLSHLGGVDTFWAGLVVVPALASAGLVAVVRAAGRRTGRPTTG